MGLSASKFGQEIEQEKPAQGSLPSTPILTPKTKLFHLDPRSPSENIVRTPIEGFLEKHKKCITVSEESISLENDSDTFNIYSPGLQLKNIDPRSPTIEFDRTPIVIHDKEILPTKLHNKNLDNVRKILMHSSPIKSVNKATCTKTTPPKLLESNIINPKPLENKRKSYVGLLETNLDFVETDLDNVKQTTNLNESSNNKCIEFKESCTTSENDTNELHSQGNSLEFLTPNHTFTDSITAIGKNIPTSIDPRSPTNEFIRTPIEVIKKLENCKIEDNSVTIFTDCDDDGLRAVATRKIADELANIKSVDKNGSNEIKSEYESEAEDLKDFDRKLNNLIYEDKKTEYVVRNRKVTEPKSRTPLGTRNSNTNPNKRLSKLKVHDNPQKSGRDFSRIPIFQNKKAKGKLNKQCENTPPPHFEENKKPDKHKWDPNNTMII